MKKLIYILRKSEAFLYVTQILFESYIFYFQNVLLPEFWFNIPVDQDFPIPLFDEKPDLLKCVTCRSNLSLVAQV